MSYLEVIDKLCAAALHPARTVAETRERTGKELIGCFPIHTPEEIIYAAGCIPVGMWGGKSEIQKADKYVQSFCCSIMRANIELGLSGAYDMLKAVVIPTFCDTLKCVLENWKAAVPQVPAIAIVYPQNRAIPAGVAYTVSELKRVKHELEALLHRVITDEKVEQAFSVYEEYRKTMREFTEIAAKHPEIITARKRHLIIKAGEFMDKAEYIADVGAIIAGIGSAPESSLEGPRVILTGLISEPVEILEIFDENHLVIAGDDLSLGSRKWRTRTRADVYDVYLKMAYQIADQQGDTFLYEAEKRKGRMLVEMAKEANADAVVVMMMKFCDPEEYDYPIYKTELESAGIPELYLEIDQQLTSFEQIRTRVQSFAEMFL